MNKPNPALGYAPDDVFNHGPLAHFKERPRLRISELPQGVKVFFRTRSGSIYGLEVLDPSDRTVSIRIITPKRSRYFGDAQRCVLRGATFNDNPRAPRAPDWIVQGLPLEFWGVETAESEVVVTSPVEIFLTE